MSANNMNNEYDNERFFDQYAQMPRSKEGLAAAGEWHQLKPLFPDLQGKSVLDLGCGYGWHCRFAAGRGAKRVLGLDLSEKMIAEAKKRNLEPEIEYRVCGIEEYEYPENTYHDGGIALSPIWRCTTSRISGRYSRRSAGP